MADIYYINGIRLDKTEEHIQFVRVRKAVSNEHFVVPREFVAQLIQTGVSFKSRYHDGNSWQTGADVEVYEDVFLRANRNSTAKDNLRNLPQV